MTPEETAAIDLYADAFNFHMLDEPGQLEHASTYENPDDFVIRMNAQLDALTDPENFVRYLRQLFSQRVSEIEYNGEFASNED